MSRLSRCVKTERATRRIAPCATLAKTALRNSEKRPAPTRARPSARRARQHRTIAVMERGRTAKDDGAGDGKDALAGSRVDLDIERVDDIFEEERHLYVEKLYRTNVSVVREQRCREQAHLSSDEQGNRQQHPRLRTPVVLRPHVRQELLDDVPISTRLLLVADNFCLADVLRLPALLLADGLLLLMPLWPRVRLRRLVRRFRELVFTFLLRLRSGLRLARLGCRRG